MTPKRLPITTFLTTLLLLVTLPAAQAEVARPVQHVAANALPLIYLPAPATPACLCLVDTGVDLTPDTQHSVIDRFVPFGSGAGVWDHHPEKHGTRMASVIAAPPNGWGMVGAWPAAKIVSSRSVGLGYYPMGIVECSRRNIMHNIKVVELAVGVPGVKPGSDGALTNHIAKAKADGMNVVAAAGNDGGEIDSPANHPGVFAVSGIDREGQLCKSRNGIGGAATGPELDLVTLGCDLDLAWPDGRPAKGGETSEASAFVAAVLIALRSYRPDLTADQAEQLLTSTATPTPGGPALNVDAVFRAAGLGGVWEQAAQLIPPLSTNPDPGSPPGPPFHQSQPSARKGKTQQAAKRRSRPVKPRVRIQRKGKRVTVRALNRPKNATLVITIRSRKKTRVIRRRGSVTTVTLTRGERITVRYEQSRIPRRGRSKGVSL